MKRIYLDHAGTTPMRPEVLAAMTPYFSKKFGNASSLHEEGRTAAQGLEESRATIAKLTGVSPEHVTFTSSGTEANNLALKGRMWHCKKEGKTHLITTKIEHHCVLHSAKWLETQGFQVTYLPVDKEGLVSPQAVERAITPKTGLVSVMYANNEIGTIEPIKEIGKICRENHVPFHTDAVQAFGKIPLALENVDMLTASAHKLYGPKGVGLFINKDVPLVPLLHGGGQESGLRSSTENIPGIVGFAKAAELSFKEMEKEALKQTLLRDYLIKNVMKIENTWLNGHKTKRLPNNANFGFKFIEGEGLIMMLDGEGIAASTGSACSSASLEPSHVLLALGLRHEEAHGSLRFTLGRQNTKRDADVVLEKLPPIIKRLREISPFKRSYSFNPTRGFEEEEHDHAVHE